MHPQLIAVKTELDAASARLRALSARLNEPAWSRRPAPGRWSAGECVSHLNLTSEAFLPRLRQGIDEARRLQRAAGARLKTGFAGWLVKTLAGPSRWIKVKTTPDFVPHGDRPGTELVAQFERLQDELIGLLRSADGLPLDRVTVTSPFSAQVRYNVYAAFAVIPGHQLRHLAQAEEASQGR
jgi:hypothetical protein